MAILPRFFRPRATNGADAIRVAPRLVEAAGAMAPVALELLQSGPQGLSQEQAEQRLEEYGPNVVAQEKRHTWVGLLGHALVNPLVVLLLILATVALLTEDVKAVTVMSAMAVLCTDKTGTLTQTLIIHIIRTNRIPFLQSRASWPLIVTTAFVMMMGVWLPFSPISAALSFQPLPPRYWPLIVLTLLCCALLTQMVKGWLLRRKWI